MQVQVADHLRIEQRNGVGGDRVSETRVEFLRHRRPARDPAAFEDRNLETRFREIGRADKAVMASADDYGVIAVRGIAQGSPDLHLPA